MTPYLALSKPGANFIQNWYEAADVNHFWMRHRLKFLLQAIRRVGLRIDQPLKGLDIGGGRAVFRSQIESSTQWSVDCTDLDVGALEQSVPGRGQTLLYDITQELPDRIGSYDVVFALDVVEHVENPDLFLKSAARHLKPGGHLVINVPALNCLFSRYDTCAGHLRRYTTAMLVKELASSHLDIAHSRYWGLTMIPVVLLRKWIVSLIQSQDRVIQMGFSPPNPWVERILSATLTFERLALPIRPLGTSLILVARKK